MDRWGAGNVPIAWTMLQLPGERGPPAGERGLPTGERGLPTGERGFPTGERGLPTGERGFPTGERGLPVGERGLPAGERGLPTGERALPAGERRSLAAPPHGKIREFLAESPATSPAEVPRDPTAAFHRDPDSGSAGPRPGSRPAGASEPRRRRAAADGAGDPRIRRPLLRRRRVSQRLP